MSKDSVLPVPVAVVHHTVYTKNKQAFCFNSSFPQLGLLFISRIVCTVENYDYIHVFQHKYFAD